MVIEEESSDIGSSIASIKLTNIPFSFYILIIINNAIQVKSEKENAY